MWTASVEGDSLERLNVLRNDGDIGGKPLLAFISGLIAHLDGHHDDWFIRLESLIHESLNPLAKPLAQAICGIEEIDTFREDEYVFFVTDTLTQINGHPKLRMNSKSSFRSFLINLLRLMYYEPALAN